jgi:maleate isomerase
MVPSGNRVVEPSYHKIQIDGVSFHYSKISIKKDTEEEVANMINNVPDAAMKLADAEVDIISFACTAGSFVGGLNYDQKIIEIIEKTTGIKGTTTSTAVVKALKALGIKNMIIATPYEDWINEKEMHFFIDSGFNVLDIKGLGYLEAADQAHEPPENIYAMVTDMVTDSIDGVFISCTNFRSMEVIDILETDLQVPVVTSNQATLWDMLRQTGVKEHIDGYGKLLIEL